MKITLTDEQMYAIWRESANLEPALAEASVERFDSVNMRQRLMRGLRAWYLDYLSSAPEDMVPVTDLTQYARLEKGPASDQWTMTLLCETARIVSIDLKKTGRLPLLDPRREEVKPIVHMLRNKYVRHGLQPTAFYVKGSDTAILNIASRKEPEIALVRGVRMTDGEVHSFVEDIVDQQRYINRLIVLIDRIMSTSAKGVLLFPINQKLKDFSWNEIAQRWASPDGVIPIVGESSNMPQQINTGNGDSNAYRLLEMELKLFEQTAGVGSALMGSTGQGNRGAELYNAEVENATIALADIYQTFRSLISQRDKKLAMIKKSD